MTFDTDSLPIYISKLGSLLTQTSAHPAISIRFSEASEVWAEC